MIPLLFLLASFNIPCDRLPLEDRLHAPECTHAYEWFDVAQVPDELQREFLNVAACESEVNPNPRSGDNGVAKGLFQIHWRLWLDWTNREGLNDGRFTPDNWSDPIANTEMTLLIQEEYSLKRGQDRWQQWGAKPYWFKCKAKADVYLHQQSSTHTHPSPA